jgi:hypothetical protein
MTQQARWKHTRVVGDKQIARLKIPREIPYSPMKDRARRTVEHQQPGGPAGRRVLGHELIGKRKIEV